MEILGIFTFFLFTTVSIGKVHFSAKCPFGRIGGLKIFEKKTWMPDLNFFTFFMPKNNFFSRFWAPLIFGAEALSFFFGISPKILHHKICQVWSPPPFRWTCEFFKFFFHFFLRKFIFLLKKKRGATGAGKKK